MQKRFSKIPKYQTSGKMPMVLNEEGQRQWVEEQGYDGGELPEVTVTASKPLTEFQQRDKANGVKLGRVKDDSDVSYREWQANFHKGNEATKKFGEWGGTLATGLAGVLTMTNPASMYGYTAMGLGALPGNIDKIEQDIKDEKYLGAAADGVLTGIELLPALQMAGKGAQYATTHIKNAHIPARLRGLKDEIKYGIQDLKSYHSYPKATDKKIPNDALFGEMADDPFAMADYSGKSTEYYPGTDKIKKYLRDQATKEGRIFNNLFDNGLWNFELKNLGLTDENLLEFGRFKNGWGTFASREYKYMPGPQGYISREPTSVVWLQPNMPTRDPADHLLTMGSYQIGMTPRITSTFTAEPLSRAQQIYLKKGFDAIPKGTYVTADAPGVIPQIINHKASRLINNQSALRYLADPINLKNRIFGYSRTIPNHIGTSFNAYKLLHQLGNKPGNAVLYTPGKISKFNNILTANEPKLLDAFNKYESGLMSVEEWIKTFNEWQSSFGGRPAHVDFLTGKPRYYHPIIYKGN